jgi:deoxycytidine triphosphate deaminase
MRSRAEVVRRSLLSRLASLSDYINDLIAEPPRGRAGLKTAHKLLERYPGWVSENADALWVHAPDDTARYAQLSVILQNVVLKTALIEQWFGQPAALRIPLSMFHAVEATCADLGLHDRRAVLALGLPDNFETFTRDLKPYLFSSLGPIAVPAGLPDDRFAMIQVPRFEGGEALWRPIVLGHEIAHLVVIERASLSQFDLPHKFDWGRFTGLSSGDVYQLYRQSESWVTELLCDAFMVRRFGPAAVASFAEFLDAVGGSDKWSFTHPPGLLRVKLMLEWLGPVRTPSLKPMVEPWEQAARADVTGPPTVVALAAMLETLTDDFVAVVSSWPSSRYDEASQSFLITKLLADLETGLPPKERYKADSGQFVSVAQEDLINAGWAQRSLDSKWPTAKLVDKALDSLDFLARWTARGGESEAETADAPLVPSSGGALSRQALLGRLGDRGDLEIRPLLFGSVDVASVDIRLGRRFIVMQKTGTASFRTLGLGAGPRSAQRLVEVGWNERFVLHPNELVLAGSLEYLSLPGDLAAQVVTRSSYGRLGLITATAVQVHPFYRGCLTLELLNLGEVPLELKPGERVAQLVFYRVDPPAQEPQPPTFDCPTGPEFARPLRCPKEIELLAGDD